MNITVGAFLSNFLDFSQFTVDSSENDTENNYKGLLFFFSFYILHLAYTFIMLSRKLVKKGRSRKSNQSPVIDP